MCIRDSVERYRPLAQRRHQHDWQFLSHCFIVRKQQIVIVVLRPVRGRSDYHIRAAFPGKTGKRNRFLCPPALRPGNHHCSAPVLTCYNTRDFFDLRVRQDAEQAVGKSDQQRAGFVCNKEFLSLIHI